MTDEPETSKEKSEKPIPALEHRSAKWAHEESKEKLKDLKKVLMSRRNEGETVAKVEPDLISFHPNGVKIGAINIVDGNLVFSGNLDESAKLFCEKLSETWFQMNGRLFTEAELQAAVAVSLERAAQDVYDSCAEIHHTALGAEIAARVDSLSTIDALSALDRVKAEARKEGMLRAAEIADYKATELGTGMFSRCAVAVASAIRAAIDKEKN